MEIKKNKVTVKFTEQEEMAIQTVIDIIDEMRYINCFCEHFDCDECPVAAFCDNEKVTEFKEWAEKMLTEV